MTDDSAQRQFDERLDREGGVFAENDAREAGCDSDRDGCAPDDLYGTDPDALEGSQFPGTVDDRPIDFGEEVSAPADQHLVPADEPAASGGLDSKDGADRRDEQGSTDENELWVQAQPLISEDDRTGLHLEGFPEAEIPNIMLAMGDDAADVIQDYPNGDSATGDSSTPDHGGFPERE